MNRKKFFKTISASVIGIAFLKMNPIKFFIVNKQSYKGEKIKVKMNPFAVNREKSGNKNG